MSITGRQGPDWLGQPEKPVADVIGPCPANATTQDEDGLARSWRLGRIIDRTHGVLARESAVALGAEWFTIDLEGSGSS